MEEFHSESLSLRNYHFPFNVTFHLPGICWGWAILLVHVEHCWDTKNMSLAPKSSDYVTGASADSINSLMMSLSHGPGCWWALMNDSGLIQERVFSHHGNQPVINLKGLINERKLPVCHEYFGIFMAVCKLKAWSSQKTQKLSNKDFSLDLTATREEGGGKKHRWMWVIASFEVTRGILCLRWIFNICTLWASSLSACEIRIAPWLRLRPLKPN